MHVCQEIGKSDEVTLSYPAESMGRGRKNASSIVSVLHKQT